MGLLGVSHELSSVKECVFSNKNGLYLVLLFFLNEMLDGYGVFSSNLSTTLSAL